MKNKRTVLGRVKSFLGLGSFGLTSSGFSVLFEGTRVISSTVGVDGQIKAYNFCPPVASIVNRKAKATINGKWFLLNEDGSEAKGSQVEEIRKLITKPNVLQSWKQFRLQAKIFEQIFGEVFIFALRPVGMKSVKSLWIIPNWLININPANIGVVSINATDPSEIIKNYSLTLNSKISQIEICDIYHHKELPFNYLDQLRGQSRLVSLQDPVSNIIAAYEARNVLITKRGAIGILGNETKDSIGSIPLKQGEKEDLQKQFQSYGITKEKFQVIISSANLKWQSMTFPTRDLMLFEEIEDDVRQIADNYEYPMHLLGFKTGTTFNNFSEAKKSLYQDTIIPEDETFIEGLNEFLGLNKQNFKLKVFYDHLEVFKKSESERATALKTTNEALKLAFEARIITREEWRTAIDYDPTTFNGNTFYNEQATSNKPAAKSSLV